MRLVRLAPQPSRVAEDIRAALASLGRGNTIIGGIALAGVRPLDDDRVADAFVVLPRGILMIVGVDLPDPALLLHAPLEGPWQADDWPLKHAEGAVNPASGALELAEAVARKVAQAHPGAPPMGTVIAVGPYVQTIDQPPADAAGPIRVLHPTPTSMLAATVSLASANCVLNVDQVRAVLGTIAANTPRLPDEMLLGEGFAAAPAAAVVAQAPALAPAATAAQAPPAANTQAATLTSTPMSAAASANVPAAPSAPVVVHAPAGAHDPAAPATPAAVHDRTAAPKPAAVLDRTAAPTPTTAHDPAAPAPTPTSAAVHDPTAPAAAAAPALAAAPVVAPAVVPVPPATPTPQPVVAHENPLVAASPTIPAAHPSKPLVRIGAGRPAPRMQPPPLPPPVRQQPPPPPIAPPALTGPVPDRQRSVVRWLPYAAIGLIAVLLIAAILVATGDNGGSPQAAAPASPTSAPKPPPPTSTSHAVEGLQFQQQAAGADQKCASHGFGDVQASLQRTSCVSVKRGSFAATVDGRQGAVSVAIVEFPDARQAADFKAVADTPGGGGILDIATETGKWPAEVPKFEGAAYLSSTDGNSVRIVQAVWLPGPSKPDDPGLVRAAKSALDLPLNV